MKVHLMCKENRDHSTKNVSMVNSNLRLTLDKKTRNLLELSINVIEQRESIQ